MDNRRILTLSEGNDLVHSVIDHYLADAWWMEAEVAEISERGGHCYLTLIEKDELRNVPIARASAKCWRNKWEKIRDRFISTAGSVPQKGMKILFLAKADFHIAYGFSWIIDDIDPTYTLGDMARRRKEIIQRLKAEGVIDLNRRLTLSPYAQHIAVVSSAKAAGYGDFINQLSNNPFGFIFHTKLFNATMQGEQVEESIISALADIFDEADNYDAVIIIRGGGSAADLAGFDTLRLAEHVANFPLPVITGIGHDRDETILDIVAHTHMKTPTAAAEMLIDNLHGTWQRLTDIERTIAGTVGERLERARMRLTACITPIPFLVGRTIERQRNRIDRLTQQMQLSTSLLFSSGMRTLASIEGRITNSVQQKLINERHRIALLMERANSHDPQLILDRGYTITTKEGKTVRDSQQLSEGDIIQTRFAKGKTVAVVTKPS